MITFIWLAIGIANLAFWYAMGTSSNLFVSGFCAAGALASFFDVRA